MSVIFQLFRVEDLKYLEAYQLDDLRTYVGNILNIPDVAERVKPRAHQVFKQLTGSDAKGPTSTSQQASSGVAEGMLLNLFSEEDLQKLNDGKHLELLKWAIICEMTHSDQALRVIKRYVYERFASYNKGQPEGGDSFYQHLL